MAFNKDNFAWTSVAQGSPAPKMGTYRTTDDAKAAVIASGYFDDLAKKLEAGDFILVSASDGEVVVSIAAVTAGVVTTLSVALA